MNSSHHTLIIGLFFLATFWVTGPAYSQAPSNAPVDTSAWVESDWVVLPSLFWSPRTRLGGGGSVRYFPRRKAGTRPSSVQAAFIYTAKKQMIISLTPDLFFNNGKRRFFANALYLNFPDQFYGIGNDALLSDSESFTARTASLLLSGEQEVRPGLSLGLQSWLRNERITETEEDGLLASGALTGSDRGTAVGLGTFFRWDTRDNFFYTTQGLYVRGALMRFDPTFGSDYGFTRYTLDIRRFIPIGWRHVIALRSYNLMVDGDAPFQLLPEIGGQELMRGYAHGRYKNNIMLALQTEYRLIVYGPIGFVVFASAADVQRRFKDVGSDRLIFSAGPGFRFLMNEDGLNFRIDYGIGRDGGDFYFTLGEAF